MVDGYDPRSALASLGDATVQVKLSAIRALEQLQQETERQLHAARADLELAERRDPDLRQVAEALDDAMIIVRYAVANLPPIGNPGWPHAELARLAEAIDTLPGKRPPAELAITLREFARKAAKWSRAYAEGRAADLLAEENAARSKGNGLLDSLGPMADDVVEVHDAPAPGPATT